MIFENKNVYAAQFSCGTSRTVRFYQTLIFFIIIKLDKVDKEGRREAREAGEASNQTLTITHCMPNRHFGRYLNMTMHFISESLEIAPNFA